MTPSAQRHARTYKFGIVKVLAGEDLAMRELELQQQTWNRLCEKDEQQRYEFWAWLQSADPALLKIDERIEGLKAELSRQQAADGEQGGGKSAGDRDGLVGELEALAKQARERRKQVLREFSSEVTAMRKVARKELLEIARASGLWWCHSEDVMANFERARLDGIRTGRRIRGREFSGDGTLCVRLTSGGMKLTINDLMAGKTKMVCLRPMTEAEMPERMKSSKGDGGYRAELTMTVRKEGQDGEDGNRYFVSIVTVHRPVEEEAQILEVQLTRRSIGRSLKRGEWSASLVVRENVAAEQAQERAFARVTVDETVVEVEGQKSVRVCVWHAEADEGEVWLDGKWAGGVRDGWNEGQRARRIQAKLSAVGGDGLSSAATVEREAGQSRTQGTGASEAEEGVGADTAAAIRMMARSFEAAELAGRKAARRRNAIYGRFAAEMAARGMNIEVVMGEQSDDEHYKALIYKASRASLLRSIRNAAEKNGLKVRVVREQEEVSGGHGSVIE